MMSKLTVYLSDGRVIEKEMKPQDQWQIDPVFMQGIGDDSKLVRMIEEYIESLKDVKSGGTDE